jgi:hypothetical protein
MLALSIAALAASAAGALGLVRNYRLLKLSARHARGLF